MPVNQLGHLFFVLCRIGRLGQHLIDVIEDEYLNLGLGLLRSLLQRRGPGQFMIPVQTMQDVSKGQAGSA
jgi:hypothetical protein